MAKDIGMTIRKGIVVPFLPCLVAFWGFHPYMFFHFFLCFFVTCICMYALQYKIDNHMGMVTPSHFSKSALLQVGSPSLCHSSRRSSGILKTIV